MQLWTKARCDPLLRELNQMLRQKEEEFYQMEATFTTMVPTQRLTRLHSSQNLRDYIEALQ